MIEIPSIFLGRFFWDGLNSPCFGQFSVRYGTLVRVVQVRQFTIRRFPKSWGFPLVIIRFHVVFHVVNYKHLFLGDPHVETAIDSHQTSAFQFGPLDVLDFFIGSLMKIEGFETTTP